MASGNGISGLLNFKMFWGSMPPDRPRDWCHRRASGLPPHTQISSYGHVAAMNLVALFGGRPVWSRVKSIRFRPSRPRVKQKAPACSREPDSLFRDRAGGGVGGFSPQLLANLVHTFDFLYERTHSRRRNAHKNGTFKFSGAFPVI